MLLLSVCYRIKFVTSEDSNLIPVGNTFSVTETSGALSTVPTVLGLLLYLVSIICSSWSVIPLHILQPSSTFLSLSCNCLFFQCQAHRPLRIHYFLFTLSLSVTIHSQFFK